MGKVTNTSVTPRPQQRAGPLAVLSLLAVLFATDAAGQPRGTLYSQLRVTPVFLGYEDADIERGPTAQAERLAEEARRNLEFLGTATSSPTGSAPPMPPDGTGAEPPADGDGEALARQEQALTDLQYEVGALDPAQLELLDSLAFHFQEEGQHEQAIEHLNQALQITRVNEGLYSPRQERYFEALIESYLALNDYEQADAMQESLFFSARRHYEPGSPELIAARRRWADWNIEYFQRHHLYRNHPSDIGHERNLSILRANDRGRYRYPFALHGYDLDSTRALAPPPRRSPRYLSRETRRLNEAEETYEALLNDDTADRTALVLKLLATEYLRNQESLLTLRNNNYRMQELPLAHQDAAFITRRTYLDGVDRLEERVAELDDDSPEQRELLLQLADWHQLYDRPRRARDIYEQLHTDLAGSGADEEAIEAFFEPRPLVHLPAFVTHQFMPDEPPPSDLPDSTEPPESGDYAALGYTGYIDVKVSIHTDGNMTRYQTLDSSPDTDGATRNALRAYLSNAIFRPRLEDGEVAAREGLMLRYYYRHANR